MLDTVTESIKTTFEDLFASITGQESEKILKVQQSLQELKAAFQNVGGGTEISYATDERIFAYLYNYLPFRFFAVRTVIQKCPVLTNLLLSENLVVSSIGGGPCTDVLAINSLLTTDIATNNTYYLFDISDTWQPLVEIFSEKLKLNLCFSCFDALDPEIEIPDEFGEADVFVFSYAINEIYFSSKKKDKGTGFKHFMTNLITAAKPRSIFVILDFFSAEIRVLIDEIIKQNSLVSIVRDDDSEFRENGVGELCGAYKNRFIDSLGAAWLPQNSGNVMWQIFQKP